ncbi:hypothetical protein ACFXKC_08505 [Streptomyces sp. NPDC059340]|uniref:hypothetical protein n=1 Tax=Streptomyces sp. NPDC059340 TaxID=3346806 RepID=UPI00369E3A15
MARIRFLRRVRDDLSSGENLEIYVTALLSLTLAALGALDVAGGKVLAAATLATLALLAGGLLGSRRQVAELAAEVRARAAGGISAEDFFSGDKPELVQQIRGARDISIVGVTLARTLRNSIDELECRAVAGSVIRIALIDPAGTAPAEAARRSTVPHRPEVYQNRLRTSIDLLRELFDSHSSASGDAVFTLRADRDGHWYQHFQAEFDRVWEYGRPADASDGFPG